MIKNIIIKLSNIKNWSPNHLNRYTKKLSATTDLHIDDSEWHIQIYTLMIRSGTRHVERERERESIDKQIHLKLKRQDINENKNHKLHLMLTKTQICYYHMIGYIKE